ncbi:MAG: hypothetical protein II923_08820, partial [Campylobacter sp.]|nr:hypothetical protein [Campylobacter sp.]
SKEAIVAVGGASTDNEITNDNIRKVGGGANGIKALSETIKYKQYNAKDDTKIKVVTLVSQTDIEENLKRKGATKPQATYNIGTKYTFAYKDLDLTEANKKILLNQQRKF